MLTKLIKHEFKASVRLLLPIYAVVAVLALICRLVQKADIFKGMLVIVPGTISVVYIISLFASIIITLILTITRFYKNLTSDEGYLMFTLPVKASALINSKLFVAVCWVLLNLALIVASFYFTFPDRASEITDGLLYGLKMEFGSGSPVIVAEVAAIMLISLIHTIMHFYTSIAIGQLFNRSKLLYSAVAYIGIYFCIQLMATITLLIISFFNNNFLFTKTSVPRIIFPFFILFYLALVVVMYISTNIIFSKKLNLE